MSDTTRFPPEVVLVVDDEDSVRRTFREWLVRAGWDIEVLVASDAESALRLAGQHRIDLAILDWNLGSGSDGLQLLEDLALFHPEITAILVTGFAHRATPLDALRMGVRDYLDKNQDLNRDTFLQAVRKQLDRIRPARRARAFSESLREFRETIEKVVPLVQATAAINDPVSLPQSLARIFRFTVHATRATDGSLVVRHGGHGETYRAYRTDGEPVAEELVPFAESLAAAAISLSEPFVAHPAEGSEGFRLQPFEIGRKEILAVPVTLGPSTNLVLELFDRRDGPFTEDDRQLARLAAELAGEIVRHNLNSHEQHRLLFEAIETALQTTQRLADSGGSTYSRPEQPPPQEVMERIRQGLHSSADAVVDVAAAMELAEAIRKLAVRHGPNAVRHCTRIIQSVEHLIDALTTEA
jgi:DNA-binding NarL/FixJ family response regulator